MIMLVPCNIVMDLNSVVMKSMEDLNIVELILS